MFNFSGSKITVPGLRKGKLLFSGDRYTLKYLVCDVANKLLKVQENQMFWNVCVREEGQESPWHVLTGAEI